MLFSERMKYKEVRTQIQTIGIDEPLKNGLWNVIYTLVLSKNRSVKIAYSLYDDIWKNYFKAPLDEMPNSVEFPSTIRGFFYSYETLWYELYDFLEFLVKSISRSEFPDKTDLAIAMKTEFNEILEKEMSGYRFIDMIIAPIITHSEIEEIGEAIAQSETYYGVATHINRSVELLSDRKSPDYRNSVKESISAVESLCKVITDDPKSTLGDGIKKLESIGVKIHPSLRSAFNQLYGYTSDEKGIRHAIMTEEATTFEEAKFMLVACSAFCNYVISLKK